MRFDSPTAFFRALQGQGWRYESCDHSDALPSEQCCQLDGHHLFAEHPPYRCRSACCTYALATSSANLAGSSSPEEPVSPMGGLVCHSWRVPAIQPECSSLRLAPPHGASELASELRSLELHPHAATRLPWPAGPCCQPPALLPLTRGLAAQRQAQQGQQHEVKELHLQRRHCLAWREVSCRRRLCWRQASPATRRRRRRRGRPDCLAARSFLGPNQPGWPTPSPPRHLP